MDNFEQQTLLQLIKNLSKSPLQDSEKLEETIAALKKIYSHNFRHLYSKFFTVIAENSQDENAILVQNLNYIYTTIQTEKQYNDDKTENFKRSILKLYDHINLDVSRINYITAMDAKNDKRQIGITEKIEKENKKLHDLKHQISDIQKNSIAILGIFSAIVITFVAGLVFTSSVLQSISTVSIYRLLLIVWILGFILTNILQMLFSFIATASNKKDLQTDKVKKTFSINKIFFIGVFIIILCWLFDAVNLRQMFINLLFASRV